MKRRYLLGVVIVIAIVAALLAWLLARPVSTKIIIPKNSNNKPTSSPEIQINNSYYSTIVPAGFELYNGQQNNATNILDRRAYFDSADSSRQLAITIGNLGENAISSVADFNFRIKSPHLYTEYTFINLPLEAQAFISATSNFEISVFWPHNQLYAAIVVSGSGGNTATPESVLTSVIDQWQWH